MEIGKCIRSLFFLRVPGPIFTMVSVEIRKCIVFFFACTGSDFYHGPPKCIGMVRGCKKREYLVRVHPPVLAGGSTGFSL